MLILTRRPQEKIYIGEDISVMVLHSTNPGVVRLGITAPKDVQIVREELMTRTLPERKPTDTNAPAVEVVSQEVTDTEQTIVVDVPEGSDGVAIALGEAAPPEAIGEAEVASASQQS